LQLQLDYYLSLTPVQFFNTIEGFRNLEKARNRTSWEQARLVALTVAQVNSTKTVKPTDIIEFDWDNEDKQTEVVDIKAERERIKNKYYN